MGSHVKEYYRHFQAAHDLVSLSKDSVAELSRSIVAYEQKSDPNLTDNIALQRFLAMYFIEQADSNRYKELWLDLKNNLVQQQDKYPTSLAAAIHMLTHWTGSHQRNPHNPNNRQCAPSSDERIPRCQPAGPMPRP